MCNKGFGSTVVNIQRTACYWEGVCSGSYYNGTHQLRLPTNTITNILQQFKLNMGIKQMVF